jgi:hypothetical protein
MQRRLIISLVILFYIIVTPGFHCGDRPDPCPNYTVDTIHFNFNTNNLNGHINNYDTLYFTSIVNDTITTTSNNTSVSQINYLASHIQAYKVIENSNARTLNYANIEFNPIVIEGQFQNGPTQGINIMYNRIEPYNRLKAALVAGRPGLYLISFSNADSYYGYYNYMNESNHCTSYITKNIIPRAQQQIQYWDSLGTTSLYLSGNSSYEIANKNGSDYFFVRVN